MTETTRTVLITNKRGLHARASAKFVTLASAQAAVVEVEKDGSRVVGTSIMGLMMLGAAMGDTVTISATGDGAEAAVSAARAAYPKALVLARAHDDDRRPKLERLGASVVLTETLELGLGLAEAAMRRLEVPEEVAREALTSGRNQDPYPASGLQQP